MIFIMGIAPSKEVSGREDTNHAVDNFAGSLRLKIYYNSGGSEVSTPGSLLLLYWLLVAPESRGSSLRRFNWNSA
jgi:hypothetical protein